MRFIHLADVHLGAAPEAGREWAEGRKDELYESFFRVLRLCGQRRIDLLLIAGDLFHRQPAVSELKELNYQFSKIADTRIIMIAGNHDFIGPHSAYSGFTWSPNVVMLSAEEMDSVYLEELNTEVYGFSYHGREICEARYDEVRPGVRERINILLAHGGDASHVPIDKKRLAQNGFDYVALGHIHKPERIGRRMAYSGSLEPLDKTEEGEHGVILGELTKEAYEEEEAYSGGMSEPDSRLTLRFLPCSLRQYVTLELVSDSNAVNASLLDAAREKMAAFGERGIFRIHLTGVRGEGIHYQKEEFMRLGRVTEVVDDTAPDYDFESLYARSRGNLIGMYIESIRDRAGTDEELARKALYYGIEALLSPDGKEGERGGH